MDLKYSVCQLVRIAYLNQLRPLCYNYHYIAPHSLMHRTIASMPFLSHFYQFLFNTFLFNSMDGQIFFCHSKEVNLHINDVVKLAADPNNGEILVELNFCMFNL